MDEKKKEEILDNILNMHKIVDFIQANRIASNLSQKFKEGGLIFQGKEEYVIPTDHLKNMSCIENIKFSKDNTISIEFSDVVETFHNDLVSGIKKLNTKHWGTENAQNDKISEGVQK